MPQALAAAIVAALSITGTAAAIATAVITLAITVGLNFIAQAIFSGGGVGKPSDGQRVIRVNVGSRLRHYGKVRIAGQLTFYESKDGNLYVLVTTSQGRINAIVEFLLNGKVVTVDGGGLVLEAGYVRKGDNYAPVKLYYRLGTDDQLAYSQLTSIFAEWTTDHRQRGCSSVLLIAGDVHPDFFAEVYEGSREPEPSITAETSLVYDPREDSTAVIGYDGGGLPIMGSGAQRSDDPATFEYRDNWALCFADYLAHPDGYGMGWDAVNWTNIAEEAAICDATVTTVDARTIARWRASGSYRMATDERRSVVREFLKAGDGFMWQDADGLANIRCGRWIAPTVHIPEKHIIGLSASLGGNAPDRANEVRVVYMEPRFGYTETEAAPVVDAAAQAALGRPEVSRFDCYYCPDHNQAARIGKRILARLGERWALTITTNLYGLNAIGERFITLTVGELGIDEVAFEVTSIKIHPAALNVEIGLLETREADFAFDAATEEGDPPGDVADTTTPVTVEEPANLTLSLVHVTLSGSTGNAIQASWDEPVRLGLSAQVQYREVGATEWLEMTVSQEDLTATSGLISAGAEYEVQARHITVNGRHSDWTTAVTVATFPLDFTGGALPGGVTYLGNGGTGTRVTSAGLIAVAANNSPRFDYNPNTLAALGILIEPARTNLAIRSTAMDNAAWTKGQTTVTADATTGPDGASTADRINETAVTNIHWVQSPTIAFTNGQTYTLTYYAQKGTGRYIQTYIQGTAFNGTQYANFDLQLGTVTASGVGATATITDEGTFWRITYTATATATASAGFYVFMVQSGAAGRAVDSYLGNTATNNFVWGFQVENAATASSFIPTTTASVTRTADALSFTIPAGVATLRYTFDDNTTQDVAVSPGAYTVPTTLNRARIKSIATL